MGTRAPRPGPTSRQSPKRAPKRRPQTARDPPGQGRTRGQVVGTGQGSLLVLSKDVPESVSEPDFTPAIGGNYAIGSGSTKASRPVLRRTERHTPHPGAIRYPGVTLGGS